MYFRSVQTTPAPATGTQPLTPSEGGCPAAFVLVKPVRIEYSSKNILEQRSSFGAKTPGASAEEVREFPPGANGWTAAD